MNKVTLFLILCMCSFRASAQRLEYKDIEGTNYVVLYAYGLPRESVKTNTELKKAKVSNSTEENTGLMRRHYTNASGVTIPISNDGYPANKKLSLAFAIAPVNVDAEGKPTKTAIYMNWATASGWNNSILDEIPPTGKSSNDVIATVATGCAAYKGKKEIDSPGTWRLPTQREGMLMFLFMQQALIMGAEGGYEVIQGKYWTATEFSDGSGPLWVAWGLDTQTGGSTHYSKVSTDMMTRCIKDYLPADNNR